MFRRPSVEKGRQVPEKHHREMLQDAKAMEEFEKKGKQFYKKKAEEAAGAPTATTKGQSN